MRTDTAWPTRRTYTVCLAVYLMLFAYGSLIPLNFAARSLDEIHVEIRSEIASTFEELSRTDFVANILLLVPAGFLGAAMLLADNVTRWRVPGAWCLVAFLAGLFGAALEVAQLFIPDRTFALSDGVAQTFGANGGIALWVLMGPGLNRWLRALRAPGLAPHAQRKVGAAVARRRFWSWAGAFSWFVLLAYLQWSPFDFNSDPRFVRDRVQNLPLVLFENYYYRPLPLAVVGIVRNLVLGMPLGLFLELSRRRTASRPAHLPTWASIVAVAFTLAMIETAQVFVPSRSPDPADVVLQTCGAFGGCVAGAAFSVFSLRNTSSTTRSLAERRSRGRLSGR